MTPVLLDTHALIWLVSERRHLGREALRLTDGALGRGNLCASSISFWEVAMQAERGRISVEPSPDRWREQVLNLGVQETPLDGFMAIRAAQLMSFHRDPADRFIAATAEFLGATLLTADRALLEWRSPLKRQDARK